MENMNWDRRRHNELSVIAFIWQELKGTKWGASINLTHLVLLKGTLLLKKFSRIYGKWARFALSMPKQVVAARIRVNRHIWFMQRCGHSMSLCSGGLAVCVDNCVLREGLRVMSFTDEISHALYIYIYKFCHVTLDGTGLFVLNSVCSPSHHSL